MNPCVTRARPELVLLFWGDDTMSVGMRRVVPFLVVLGLTGCSNAPLAGLLDCVAPARPVTGVRPEPPRDTRPPAPRPRTPASDDPFLPPLGPSQP